jgi:zinc transport system substrate-binding protein
MIVTHLPNFMLKLPHPKNILLFVLLISIITSCNRPQPHASKRIQVIASIYPISEMVRYVGGGLVDIVIVVPPSANPHVFDLTPELLRKASNADLLVLNGAGLEFWAENLKANMKNPALRTVVTSKGITLLGGHDHGNPHVWLNPKNVIPAVNLIRDALTALDSANASSYASNARTFIDSLKVLDAWIAKEMHACTNKQFVSYHASWDYFAKEYGLQQIATIEKNPGREMSARELSDIVQLMKNSRTKAVFGRNRSHFGASGSDRQRHTEHERIPVNDAV